MLKTWVYPAFVFLLLATRRGPGRIRRRPAEVNGEIAHGIALDRDGNAYIAGESTSPDFPGVNAFEPPQASTNAFVAKIGPKGSLVYSTTLGGNGSDHASGIAVDASGNAYVTGQTDSTEFPTAFAAREGRGGGDLEAFIARIVDAPLLLSTLTLDVGDLPLGHGSKTRTLTLTNTGTADMKVNSIEKKLTGDSSGCDVFTVSNEQLPFTIPAGNKRDVSVAFAPAADADYRCVLQVGVAEPVRAVARTELLGLGAGLVSVRTEYASVYQGFNAEFSLKFTNPLSAAIAFDLYVVVNSPTGQQAVIGQMPVVLSADQVKKIDEILFPVASSAPIGKYTITALAVRDGGILCANTASFTVYRIAYPPRQE